MESLTLPLYPTIESTSKIESQPGKELPNQLPHTINPQTTLERALSTLIPNKTEEDKVNRMRKHLGDMSKLFSDAQVETIMTEFQFLIDSWLDEYEKDVFSGMTLKEVLNEK